MFKSCLYYTASMHCKYTPFLNEDPAVYSTSRLLCRITGTINYSKMLGKQKRKHLCVAWAHPMRVLYTAELTNWTHSTNYITTKSIYKVICCLCFIPYLHQFTTSYYLQKLQHSCNMKYCIYALSVFNIV